jgi:hypothetical protein
MAVPPDNSWQDAPPLTQIAASQQGGTRGAQVWGVTQNYQLITNFQETPGGTWSGWEKMAPPGTSSGVVQVAAAQQNDGRCQLWATDVDQVLWTMWQTAPGGNWTGWAGPNWNMGVKTMQLAAAQQGGNRGAQVWATTDRDALLTCYQVTPGGNWSQWSGFLNAPPTLSVAACQQNDGRVQMWLLDEDQQIWSAWQNSPGGDWTGMVGPNWNLTARVQSLTASQQGGSRGAQLWATDQSNQVWTTYQESPGGTWSGWLGPNWNGAPQLMQMAACQQNNGCVALFGIDTNQMTKATFQSSPGGGWGPWGP